VLPKPVTLKNAAILLSQFVTLQNTKYSFILTTDFVYHHETAISTIVPAQQHDIPSLTSVNAERLDTAVSNIYTAEHQNTFI